MNQIAEQKTPINSVSISSGLSGTKIAPQNLGEVVKFAELMSRADIALPKHLRGNAGACMAVALQALEWGMSPFAVASKSYQVNGAIAYEAQLIVAVVNTRSGIEGRLKYAFEGEGDDRVCICTGKLDGEVLEVKSPKFKDITPKNSPLWKSDPDQQQCYYTGRTWARRHTPEVILGVYDREEAQTFEGPDNAKDVTPSIVGRLKAAQEATQQPQGEREGFSDGFAYAETETMSGDSYDPDTGEIEDQERAADASPVDAAPVGEAGAPNVASPAPTLVRYARDVLNRAAKNETDAGTLKKTESVWATDIAKLSDEDKEKAHAIAKSMRAVFNDPALLDGVLEHYAEVLDVPIESLTE
jgi:hypothetical protein